MSDKLYDKDAVHTALMVYMNIAGNVNEKAMIEAISEYERIKSYKPTEGGGSGMTKGWPHEGGWAGKPSDSMGKLVHYTDGSPSREWKE